MSEVVTAPSTPEPAVPMAPGTEPPPPAPRPDRLEIVVERRLQLQRHEGGSTSSAMTIFRVPAHVRDANKELYEPRLVSVGPYFRDQPALAAMEQHKWRCLHELLALYPGVSSADCVRAVRAVEREARRCYSERTKIFGDDAATAAAAPGEDGQSRRDGACASDFAEMLLLDGCFVLHFFVNVHRREPDKLRDVGWGLPLLLSDLLLLENQLPFFVLEALFGALSGLSPEASRLSLLMLVVSVPHFKLDGSAFYKEVMIDGVVPTQAQEIHHLLHLFYEAFVPRPEELDSSPAIPASPPEPPPQDEAHAMGRRLKTAMSERSVFVRACTELSSFMTILGKVSALFSNLLALIGVRSRTQREPPEAEAQPAPARPMVVQSVTLLRDAGVRFEKAASPRHMFDITFDAARGVLRMPRMKVDYANKAQLVNLVALEQTRRGGGGGGEERARLLLSSYAALVGSLERTGEDVAHLQKRGIVDNLLSSDDDAATKFFQQLGDCSSLDYKEHHFAAIFEGLSRYYRSSWRRHKAKFLRDHCSSPWAVLALAVAACAFCFALFKFSTTIYGLAHPCHSSARSIHNITKDLDIITLLAYAGTCNFSEFYRS